MIAAALLAGCGSDSAHTRAASDPAARQSAPVVVSDDAGRTITLPSPATRVVSLVPAQTHVVQLLAGAGALVARTAWDTDPALAHLPSTENALSPSVEWLASLRPDLVIAWPDRDARTVIARLQSLGIPVYASSVESLADIDTMIRRFGVMLGREARADSLRASLRDQLDSVRAGVASRPRPRVLYAVSIDPPMAATNATYLGELVELAGGENIFGDVAALWPQVSLEEIVRLQPEVIIRPVEHVGDDVLSLLKRRPGWRDLPAVLAGRVYAVDVNLLNRPGATVGEAARVLAGAIHAEPGQHEP
jgi:iron complex transport system substrate-binding protein